MADGKIKISELDEALQLSDNAEFPYTQDNGGVPTTFKAPANQIARKVAEGSTFTNLETTNKTLVGAINELSHLGNPILLGTTAPTSSQGANGNIYVQYTEGTGGAPDTVDSIYAKIDGAWCEIETGGGGGSGGHTIVDDSGTALTQRTNLQFNGAYSEDNATDDTTEIDVVREMTKAEFDQLTEAEKTGLINITDVTGGNDDRFQPVIYSEDEREIGVWTDGKPLYQKTVSLTNITIAVSGGYSYDISSWNIDTIVKSPEGFITISNDTDLRTVPFGLLGNYAAVVAATRSAISFGRTGGDMTCNRVVFTLVYTKTTDQAGSGQWTPQGVPTHHYSENEQVVGTWIDGSTLYEKTVIVPITADTSFDVILAWLQENDTVIIKEGFLLSGGARRVLNFYVTSNFYGYTNVDWYNNAMHLGGTINGYSGNAYVTLRYTKSST